MIYKDVISKSVILNDEFKEHYNEDLSGEYLGIVVDNNDEKFEGRCKIRVFDKFDNLQDEDLPWAYPRNSAVFAGGDGNGSFSFPKKGHFVRVFFNQGDIYHPEYESVLNINDAMKDEIASSYKNCQVLTYDVEEDLKIIYTQNKGLMIWLKGSFMNILPSGQILINHVGSTSKILFTGGDLSIQTESQVTIESPFVKVDAKDIRLGTEASHPVPMGDELMMLLMKMAIAIDSKLPSGTPYPTLPMVQTSSVLSSTAFVAD